MDDVESYCEKLALVSDVEAVPKKIILLLQ